MRSGKGNDKRKGEEKYIKERRNVKGRRDNKERGNAKRGWKKEIKKEGRNERKRGVDRS